MKKFYTTKILLALSIMLFSAFVGVNEFNGLSESRKTYLADIKDAYVTIGNQEWMSENLNVSTFRNGDLIPEAKTAEEWKAASESGKPAWSYYNFDPKNGVIYGKLYNWHAVNDRRGLAPSGWRIPADEDWMLLLDFLGGMNIAGNSLKSPDLWEDYNGNIGKGSNESRFSGLPGGLLNGDGTFYTIEKLGYWWSSSETNPSYYGGSSPYAWSYILNYYSGRVYRYDYLKSTGLSVRCLKDNQK